MDPISKFSHDQAIYIYQPANIGVSHGPPPQKPFEINTPEKSNKAKKDKDSRKQKGEKDKDPSKQKPEEEGNTTASPFSIL